jgi:hypothetical protein
MSRFTHKGWFSFCPVYVGGSKDTPDVIARRPWLEPVLHLAIWAQGISIATCQVINPDWQPTWRIRITGIRP